ncbi:MAG: MarR family transcriptional regulator [Halioglobus sp.]
MDVDETLLFDNQICFPLYSAANAVVRAYRPLLSDLDLTYLQYMTLMLLWERPQMTVKELGERLALDSGTLTPLLKRLEAKGLVTRNRDKQDERVRVIKLTPQGRALRKKATGIPGQLACNIGLEKQQARQIKKMCEHLLQALADD